MAIETAVTDYPMFIDGTSVPSMNDRWIDVRNPATREVVGRVPDGTEADVDRAASGPGGRSRGGSFRCRYGRGCG